MTLHIHLAYAPDDESLRTLRAALPESIRLSCGPAQPTPADYHVLVAGRPSRAMLTASANLHTLIIPFAGLPAVTRTLMLEYPHIAVHNLHHNAAPTAEMAVALLLAAARLLIPADRALRQHDWRSRYDPLPMLLLAGKTALILGYGTIGMRVGEVCRTLGMRVVGTRRSLTAPQGDMYPASALHQLLPQAHALILTLPATDETEGLIGARELHLLPPGAVLVNVGRADVVDQAALYDALRSGHLHGAGLDVWYNYPPDEAARQHTPPADAPFHTLDNVVMSPHRGGAGGSPDVEQLRMAALADLLVRAARGDALPHRVDLQAGY